MLIPEWTDDIYCPHCGARAAGNTYYDGEEDICPNCDKKFIVNVNFSTEPVENDDVQ